MISDESGRIRLTWPQLVWGMTMLMLGIGAWFDIRYQVRAIRESLQQTEARIDRIEQRVILGERSK